VLVPASSIADARRSMRHCVDLLPLLLTAGVPTHRL
jgi:hypothetical protein